MRLAINSGGLDSFFNGISSFINTAVNIANSDSLIKSFQTVADKTNNVNGGVGTLSTALGYIQTCKVAEETRKTAVLAVKTKTDNFIKTAISVDNAVAASVSISQEAFYQTNPWLRPPAKPFNPFDPSTWNSRSLQKSWDDIKTTAKKCWDGVVKFVKSPVGKIVIGVAVIAALAVATVLTGGVAGVIIAGALKGALIGAAIGAGVGAATGAIEHVTSTGSWAGVGSAIFNGAADGFFSGAIGGALMGGLGGAGEALGALGKLGTGCNALSKLTGVAKISGGISIGMAGFDLASGGAGLLLGANNPLTSFNAKLHSSAIYNTFQVGVGAVAVFSAGGIKGFYKKTPKPVCFVAGTMILTAAGLVAIENIKVGDKVISTNSETKETGEKTVLQTFVNKSNELAHIFVSGEEIIATQSHLFYEADNGWTSTASLHSGNILLLPNANRVKVEGVTIEETDEPIKVYNFEVADWHTYHVGNIGILVHNRCVKPKSGGVENSDGTVTYTKKINGKNVSVTYNGENANFSPYAKRLPNGQQSVKIKYSGSRRQDYVLADKAAGYTSTNPRPTGSTWHHVEDMSTMQLVDSKIHNVGLGGFPHAGGVSIYEKLTGIKYKQ